MESNRVPAWNRQRNRIRLSEALDQFLIHSAAQHAARTVADYRLTNRAMVTFVGDKHADEFRATDLEAFLAHLRGPHVDSRGRSHAGIGAGGFNAYLARMRPFITWMYYSHILDRDYGRALRRIRRPERVRLQLEATQVRALMEGASTPRDRALIAVGFFTAMRKSELQTIRLGDLDMDKATVFCHVWKTNQEDVLPLSPELRVELERWLTAYQRSIRRNHRRSLLPTDYLIPSYTPHRYAPGMRIVDGMARHNDAASAVDPRRPVAHPELVVKAGLRRLGIPDLGEGVHTLRRSAARQMFDALVATRRYDGAIRVVQALLHHRSLQTTEQYIGLSSESITRDAFLRTAILLREEACSAPAEALSWS